MRPVRGPRRRSVSRSSKVFRHRLHWAVCLVMTAFLLGGSLLALFLASTRSSHSTTSKLANSINHDDVMGPNQQAIELRLRNALWSYFAGDALAAPTHWFYGGQQQIRQYYQGLITDYTKPSYALAGSIMNKSNLNGGGRAGAFGGGGSSSAKSIIGDVINHGKAPLWDPSKQIHYHATLSAGENTLEVQLARVLMKSIVAKNGAFDADHFRQAYIDFMTTPGSHNDAYASTCHRMFFRNMMAGKDPKDCPDNDMHNVDTMDGLVLPTIVSLSKVGQKTRMMAAEADDGAAAREFDDATARDAADCVRVTRNSPVLERSARAWNRLVIDSVTNARPLAETVEQTASSLGFRQPSARDDEMTACYLDSALPVLLNSLYKYAGAAKSSVWSESLVWNALLANANTGGENVHRGSCEGAVLGGQVSNEKLLDSRLAKGLYERAELEKEIDDFIRVVMR